MPVIHFVFIESSFVHHLLNGLEHKTLSVDIQWKSMVNWHHDIYIVSVLHRSAYLADSNDK
jgi:hypothetical protein